MKFRILALCLFMGWSTVLYADKLAESLSFLERHDDYVNLSSIPGLKFDLRYAGANNFVGKNMYGEFNQPYLHRIAANKLAIAASLLRERNPRLGLLIYDALRPRSVQKELWAMVEGSAQQKYVANPKYGSIHNYGFAVDLTIIDENGKELDMGTGFDDFTKLSQPRYEDMFIKKGLLTKEQLDNRKLLREVMTKAGFIQLPLEWWHFDALRKKQVKSNYKIIE